jgi:hypothetical protein
MSARLVALTSEMDTEGRKEVKPEEILALQPNELRAHNPGLVKTIEDEVRAPLDTKIGEMTTEATAVQPTLDLIPDLRKALKLNDDTDTVDVIKAAVSHLRQAGTDLRDAVLAKVLDKKLKGEDEKSRNLVRRIIMSEMKTREVTLSGDEAKDEAAVSEMVNEIISSSDDLKQIVSEMEDTPASLPSSSTERSGQARTLKAGDKTSNLRVRSAV